MKTICKTFYAGLSQLTMFHTQLRDLARENSLIPRFLKSIKRRDTNPDFNNHDLYLVRKSVRLLLRVHFSLFSQITFQFINNLLNEIPVAPTDIGGSAHGEETRAKLGIHFPFGRAAA